MSTEAQEKKDPPKKEDPFTESVTYRRWDEGGKKFLDGRMIGMFRKKDKDGKELLMLRGPENKRTDGVAGGVPPKGSEIEDKDGVVYVITAAYDRSPKPPHAYPCYATKKK